MAKEDFIEVVSNPRALQEERIQALFQLMNIADKESLDAIISSLENDTCEIVRHEAAFVLGETAAAEAIEPLKRAVLEDTSQIVKHEALLALGTIADKSIIPFMEEQLESEIPLVSESAKIALQRLKMIENPYRGPEKFKELNLS